MLLGVLAEVAKLYQNYVVVYLVPCTFIFMVEIMNSIILLSNLTDAVRIFHLFSVTNYAALKVEGVLASSISRLWKGEVGRHPGEVIR